MKNLEHLYDIGSFDEIFDILKPVAVKNDFGEEVVTYEHFQRLMGSFDFKRSTEKMDAEQVTGLPTAKSVIRFLPGIDHRYKLVRFLDMTTWNITGITDEGRQRFHILDLKRPE